MLPCKCDVYSNIASSEDSRLLALLLAACYGGLLAWDAGSSATSKATALGGRAAAGHLRAGWPTNKITREGHTFLPGTPTSGVWMNASLDDDDGHVVAQ
jgi:hypothetical protein